jgi:MauM/NapG family ferredoxin protein
MNRRGILQGAVGVLAGVAAGLSSRAAKAAPLRPPGALAESDFARACIRCFRCAEVCPVKAIRFESAGGLRAVDLPYISARDRGCVLCMKCTEACPTGALRRIPADSKTVQGSVHMGVPVLDRQACVPWRGDGVCRLCFYVCPYQETAVMLVGPQQAPSFNPRACVGCGLCEEACPSHARAIRIRPPRPA